MRLKPTVLLTLAVVAMSGCDRSDADLTAWRQQQVTSAQEQVTHQTITAQALVEADSQARKELVLLERDLQAERAAIGHQRDTIELERKALAVERQRVPVMAALVHSVGIIVLCALPLVVCWQLLSKRSGEVESSELEELLILDYAEMKSPLLHGQIMLERNRQPPLPVLNSHSEESEVDEDEAFCE